MFSSCTELTCKPGRRSASISSDMTAASEIICLAEISDLKSRTCQFPCVLNGNAVCGCLGAASLQVGAVQRLLVSYHARLRDSLKANGGWRQDLPWPGPFELPLLLCTPAERSLGTLVILQIAAGSNGTSRMLCRCPRSTQESNKSEEASLKCGVETWLHHVSTL